MRTCDLCLKCNVFLLVEIFEKFKNNSLKNYGLCPSHYLSAPALSWDAILSMIKVEFELISDADIFNCLLEKALKVEFLTFLRDISKPAINIWNLMTQSKNQNIIYLEANNFHGYAMSKVLPTSRFKVIDPKDFHSNKYSSSSKGCVLEIDFEYPKELHELHNEYHLPPDKIEIIK